MSPGFATLCGSLMLLNLVSCSPRESTAIMAESSTHSIPLVEMPRSGTYLGAIDLAVASDRTIHCAYGLAYGPKGAAVGSRLYYQRGVRDSGGWTWSTPRLLLEGGGSPARVELAGSRIHVITGLFLRHFSSEDTGLTWKDEGQLVSGDSASARILDVTAVEDTLIVPYISHLRTSPGSRFRIDMSRTMLHVIRWWPGGQTSHRVLAGYPVAARATPGPRVVAHGNTVHLVCGIRGESAEWSAGAGVRLPSRGSFMQFDSFRSEDAGRTWSRLENLPFGTQWDLGSTGKLIDIGFGNPDLDISADSAGATLVWGLVAVNRHRREAGSRWSGPRVIDTHPVEEHDPVAYSTIQTVATSRGDVAVWIRPSTERTGLERYMGMITPKRARSDLYGAVFPEGSEGKVGGEPVLDTDGTTYTRSVRVRAVGDSLYVLCNDTDLLEPEFSYNPQFNMGLHVLPLQAVFSAP